MKQRQGYLPEDAMFPFQGLDTLTPSPQEDPRFSPRSENVLYTKGTISKRSGYTYLGDAFDPADANPVMLVVEFEDLAGVKTLLAFTTKKQWRYDASGEEWINITKQTTGSDVNWTGAEEDTFDYVIMTGLDGSSVLTRWIIVTNGKDKPRYWDGTLTEMADWTPTGISNFKTCKTLRNYSDHLFLGNIVYTTGSDQITKFYWGDFQSLVQFTSGDPYLSGDGIFSDVDGPIQKFTSLGDRMYVYGPNSIHSIVYVGGTVLFVAEKILGNTRLVSPRSIAEIGPYHLFLSQENVVYFDGSRLTREVGDRIYRSYRDELAASERHLAFAFHDNARREVYFNYPTGSEASALYHVEYSNQDLLAAKWAKLDYYDRLTSIGFFSRDVDLRCDSTQLAGVTCSSITITCAQGSVKGGFPVRVMGTAGGRVCLADDTTQNDTNQVVEAFWDSIDFTPPSAYQSQFGRWLEIELDLAGFEVDVYYSIDQGISYEYVEKLNLGTRFAKYKVNIDVMSPTFRIRLLNNCASSTFQLRWMRLWVQPGGAA